MINEEPFVVLGLSGFVSGYDAHDWHTEDVYLMWQSMLSTDNALSIWRGHHEKTTLSHSASPLRKTDPLMLKIFDPLNAHLILWAFMRTFKSPTG